MLAESPQEKQRYAKGKPDHHNYGPGKHRLPGAIEAFEGVVRHEITRFCGGIRTDASCQRLLDVFNLVAAEEKKRLSADCGVDE